MLETLAMARSAHTRLRMFLDSLLGRDHPATQRMYAFFFALIERGTELEEYSYHKPSMNPKLPALLNRWIQTCLLDWIARKW